MINVENEISKYWTPEEEEDWAKRLNQCQTFAQRYLVTTFRNVIKYDFRTNKAKIANAQERLQLVIATNDDLEELANLEASICGITDSEIVAKRLEDLKKIREELKEKGINRGDLGCQ